jgi:DNA helicase-2/ATP-dependent DNA helicase PcrA
MDLSDGPDTVKLMTAHTSKGLEFRHVFVVQLVDARFPGRNRGEAIPFPDALIKEKMPTGGDAHLEEERRLFYVAATRAKDRLYLTGSEDTGGSRKKKPSRFVSELMADETCRKLIKTFVQQGRSGFDDPESSVNSQVSSVAIELPSHFSFSQLAAFESCPLQYKFAHLLKIPTLDKGSLNFGKTIHAVIEEFITHYKDHPDAPMPLEELFARYDERWTGEWFEDADDRDRHHEAGLKAITSVHAQTLRDRPTPWLQEAPFTLKIGKYVLKGQIDRVDKLPDGRAVIIDYKTGRTKDPTSAMKEQLRIYQLAVADVYGAQTAAMRFWFVQDNEIREVEPDAGTLDKVRERLEKKIIELETSDFAATPDSHTCRFCDFKDLCRFKVI